MYVCVCVGVGVGVLCVHLHAQNFPAGQRFALDKRFHFDHSLLSSLFPGQCQEG